MRNKSQTIIWAAAGCVIAILIAWLLTELGAPAAGAILLAFALVGSIGAVLYFTLIQKHATVPELFAAGGRSSSRRRSSASRSRVQVEEDEHSGRRELIGTSVHRGTHLREYADGSIKAKTPSGWRRFRDLQALERYLDGE